MKLSSHSIYSCWVRLASSDFYLHLHADDFQICFLVKIFLLTFKISLKKVKMKVLVTQSCLTLCNPLDCSPTGSSVHGILQAWILEWVVIPFSRGFSQPRQWTQSPALQADSSQSEPARKPRINYSQLHMDDSQPTKWASSRSTTPSTHTQTHREL